MPLAQRSWLLRTHSTETLVGAGQGAWDLLIIWGQLYGLAGELRVEVVQAIVICDLGLEGRQGLLLFEQVPVYASEEGMGLDVGKPSLRPAAKPLFGILGVRVQTRMSWDP